MKRYCIDCGKRIQNWKAKRCVKCWHKFNRGKNNAYFKGGRPNCDICGKLLSAYDGTRCLDCRKGKKHQCFLHGNRTKDYGKGWGELLRIQIRKRDNYTCQNCGMDNNKCFDKFKCMLNVHHINYNKYDNKESNLISLCCSCHMKTNYNRDYWHVFYKYIIENKLYEEKI